mmetsp:Transcript_39439/g.59595  ORF Transcript_39439/g.59595 Transcript_39439/m.59595 type:complete len:127 (-) Transcript_39439:120-500(-)|eukprot:CAMPEP_0194763486 /NCGR_PEP_ID=MMETSP0323_2-20130528/19559_1 /TAXON_ID=2866 ORGANISM="Crypthecodinium cohnii, Strain Seligo" /NCGR_SAMPLE_ID=MMETSP0323_2 /ASSEMBLY_ACC=CAM_ASM_000346 /LENGTH=126 /DNA_ID=CAMNT_0039688387 /DNA_START=91 /DNA_END=471 /DNA_ORIENTATION=+
MTFASFARWAIPRNVNCSSFNQKIAANMMLKRGLASAPILRLAAEPPPLGGFVEQRGAVPAGSAGLKLGEDSDDLSVATCQAMASLLANITELELALHPIYSEVLPFSMKGVQLLSLSNTCVHHMP